MKFPIEGPLPLLATAKWRNEGTFGSTPSSAGLFSNGKTFLPDICPSLPSALPNFLLHSDSRPQTRSVAKHWEKIPKLKGSFFCRKPNIL